MASGRIYITGASGSGKSTLARDIATATGLTIHDLDQVARIGGGTGPERPVEERDQMVDSIRDSGSWIVEGIHLGWTRPLLEEAEHIIWLDHVTWARSSQRIVRRFVGGAIAEARRQRGWRRYLRLRDYQRHLRDLAAAIPESRRYHSDEAGELSRAATESALRPYWDTVIHCRTEEEVEAAFAAVTGAVATS